MRKILNAAQARRRAVTPLQSTRAAFSRWAEAFRALARALHVPCGRPGARINVHASALLRAHVGRAGPRSNLNVVRMMSSFDVCHVLAALPAAKKLYTHLERFDLTFAPRRVPLFFSHFFFLMLCGTRTAQCVPHPVATLPLP